MIRSKMEPCLTRSLVCVILCAIFMASSLNCESSESTVNNELLCSKNNDVPRLRHLFQPLMATFEPIPSIFGKSNNFYMKKKTTSSRQPRFGTVTIGLNEPPSYTVTSKQLAESLRVIVWAGIVSHMMLVFMLPVITLTWKNVFCQYAIVDCKDNFGIPLYRPDFLKAFIIDERKTVELNEKNSVKKRKKRGSGGILDKVQQGEVDLLHSVHIKTTEPSALEGYVQTIFQFLDLLRSSYF